MDFNDYVPGWVYKQTYETYIYSDPYVDETLIWKDYFNRKKNAR